MAMVDRIKNILLTPKTEWSVVADEITSTTELLKNYVAPLAAIPAICGFIGGSLIGYGSFGFSFKVSIAAGISNAIFGYVMSFVSIFLIGFIINALAPTFHAEKSDIQAKKLTAYSFTASWLGGVFLMIPGLRMLGLLCGLYSIYLLYLGLPRLMKCPEDKAVAYTVVIVIAAIVVSVVIAAVSHIFTGMGGPGSGMFGSPSSSVTFDKDSRIGKLEDFNKKMEEANKQMEAAQKSGNQEEVAKAALNAMGTALGGGKAVEPLEIDQLKAFVPETLAGLPKKSNSAEKTSGMGLTISKAEARYGEGNNSIRLEMIDTGGGAGWMTFAGWGMMQSEKEDEYGTEKTYKADGRMVHERSRKDGQNEYDLVLAQRFIVTAKGSGVDLNALKSAVNSIDLAKLEALKDVAGIKK